MPIRLSQFYNADNFTIPRCLSKLSIMDTIIATPTNSKSTFYQINAFLQSLQDYPGGPHVCTTPISFTHTKEKAGWVKHFPDSLGNQTTYSQSKIIRQLTVQTAPSKILAILNDNYEDS